MSEKHSGWIGVDLDATLAEYSGYQGPTHIGEPVPKMLQRVKEWLAAGITVKIMTARVSRKQPEEEAAQSRKAIEEWCLKHLGTKLPVTSEKDYKMWELWDDRTVQVIPNTGERVDGKP